MIGDCGISSSSLYALIGASMGAVIAKPAPARWLYGGVLKTVAFIFASPVLGYLPGSITVAVVAVVSRVCCLQLFEMSSAARPGA